jgi:hypothetical protein
MNSVPKAVSYFGAHWLSVTAAYLICTVWAPNRSPSLQIYARDADRARIVLW